MNTEQTAADKLVPPFLMDVGAERNLALTLQARAAAALKADDVKAKIKEAVAASADITEVLNVDARHQAHRIGMTLMKLRTGIKSTGKLSREDAQAFSKAVIKAEDELVALITPEETRIMALRDAFDERVRLEEEAKAKAEKDRVERIEHALNAMRAELVWAVGKSAEQIAAKRVAVGETDMSAEFWQEYHARAMEVKDDVIAQLAVAFDAQHAVEQEALRVKAEQEAEAARVQAEAKENARRADELRVQQAEMARMALEQQRLMEETQRKLNEAQAKLEADRKAFEEQQQAVADAQAAADAEHEEKRCNAHVAELIAADVAITEESVDQAPRDESHLRVLVDRSEAPMDQSFIATYPLDFAYDEIADVLTVEGINYHGEVFRQLGGLLELGQRFTLRNRADGVVVIFKGE